MTEAECLPESLVYESRQGGGTTNRGLFQYQTEIISGRDTKRRVETHTKVTADLQSAPVPTVLAIPSAQTPISEGTTAR
jgi:hypothetical protein